jgi:hypothetical protein
MGALLQLSLAEFVWGITQVMCLNLTRQNVILNLPRGVQVFLGDVRSQS